MTLQVTLCDSVKSEKKAGFLLGGSCPLFHVSWRGLIVATFGTKLYLFEEDPG